LFNERGVVMGWSDSPLTDKGRKQVESAAKELADVDFASAYSSDSGRALETANLIIEGNASKPSLTALSGLREQSYGGFEGGTDAERWTPVMEKFGFKQDAAWT
jgi:broad specificity phosphatase PhoE